MADLSEADIHRTDTKKCEPETRQTVVETDGKGLSPTATDITPYTVFSVRQRFALVALLGYLGLASSLTATIYFPLIDLLAERYNVSVQAINLTITLYLVFQGITPSLWSPLSDSYGRRPVFLVTFAIYTLGSLGLSITDRKYPALLVLRAVQSLGGSAILSIAYGVVADVTVPAERGRFLAPMVTAMNIGPCFGPVMGGGIMLATGDPRWCFRALLIFGATGLLLIGFALPETGRSVVGNGSVAAKSIWRTWWAMLSASARCRRSSAAVQVPAAEQPALLTGRGTWTMPHPLASLRILAYPDSILTLWLAASPYALWFCVQTSISPVFGGLYGFSPLGIGFCFLAGGAGVLAGGFVAGHLLDRNYRHAARIAGFPAVNREEDKKRGRLEPVDVDLFPIEQARSRGSIPILVASLGTVVGYGWALARHAHVHPAVPLVLQALLGCKCTVILQIYSALIVDVFPDRPGTAAASNNITRCILSAVALTALDPLVHAIGYGWFFTLAGLTDAVGCVAAVVALRRWGKVWRSRRRWH